MPLLFVVLFIVSSILFMLAIVGVVFTIVFKIMSWLIAGLLWVVKRHIVELDDEPNIIINIEDNWEYRPMRDITPMARELPGPRHGRG